MVIAYGSTSVYICDPESDIDICICLQPEFCESTILPECQRGKHLQFPDIEGQKHVLQSVISRAVDTVALYKKEELNHQIPIIRCETGDFDNPIRCDISMNKIGVLKTLYIHFLYEVNCSYLPLFWILVKWARDVGLIKSADGMGEHVLKTAEFYALIVHLLKCDQIEELEIVAPSRKTSISSLHGSLDKLNANDEYKLGARIYDFYQKASDLSGNVELIWPNKAIPKVQLDESQTKKIAAYANTAFTCLLVTRDCNKVLKYCLQLHKEQRELQRELPPSLSYNMGKDTDFHANMLSELTKATVTITPVEGKDTLHLTANGSALAIANLRTELQSMMHCNKALVLGRLFLKSARYFMAGSGILIVKYNSNVESHMKFYDSNGPYEPVHKDHARKAVYMNNIETDDQWKKKEFQRLLSHTMRQLENFPSQNEVLKNSLEVTARFGAFYLVDLSHRLPCTQTSLSIQELQLGLEKGRCVRKSWKRGEFHRNFEGYFSTSIPDQSDGYTMKQLPEIRGNPFVEKIKGEWRKRKNDKKGIAASFTPGLFKHNSCDDSDHQKVLHIYRQTLQKCKFKLGQSGSRVPCFWKISIAPSASYEAQIILDKQMNLLRMEQRTLYWVYGTIISGNKMEFCENIMKSSDIRLQIGTADEVKDGSDLYKACLLNRSGKLVIPIQMQEDIEPKKERVIFSPEADVKVRESITGVRHIQDYEMFTNGSVDASIVYGVGYYGQNLEVTRRFCDLNLYFNPEKLRQLIKNYVDSELLEEFTREIFDTSIEIQESMEQFVT